MKKQILTIVGAGLLGLMVPTASNALVFDFSFTNATGTVDGTVTGQIFGLVNGTNVAATDVILTSYPSGLGLPTAPLDVFVGATIKNNTFDVAGNQIISGTFESDFGSSMSSMLSLWPLRWDAVLLGPNGGEVVSDGPATYSVPEPSTWAMMLLGFAGLGYAGYRKSRKVVSIAA